MFNFTVTSCPAIVEKGPDKYLNNQPPQRCWTTTNAISNWKKKGFGGHTAFESNTSNCLSNENLVRKDHNDQPARSSQPYL